MVCLARGSRVDVGLSAVANLAMRICLPTKYRRREALAWLASCVEGPPIALWRFNESRKSLKIVWTCLLGWIHDHELVPTCITHSPRLPAPLLASVLGPRFIPSCLPAHTWYLRHNSPDTSWPRSVARHETHRAARHFGRDVRIMHR